MTTSSPVIVVPGITGTYLRDHYQMPPDLVWGVLEHDYTRLALHPDNLRYEAYEPARVQADTLFEIAYKELVQELRYNLRKKEDEPVPVFPFGYDWRQPLDAIEEKFAAFMDEVIERTLLLRHYAEDPQYAKQPTVNLVGHSMGGLIITGYLERRGKAAKVNKVVTLATPYRGSYEVIAKLATGTAALGPDDPASREREAARVTPALYHLLPTIAGGLEITAGLPKSLYDPGLWQTGIIATIEEYVRLHGVTKMNRAQQASQAKKLFTSLLNTGRTYRERLDKFRLAQAGLQADDWLCVVGVNSNTRVKLPISQNRKREPIFDLSDEHRINEWENENEDVRHLTGDGTVPYDSAVPPFLDAANVVCVTPDDFAYYEVQDKLFSSIAGFHGILPNMDMLHRLIVRHFTGKPDPLGTTWGRPAPGVAQAQWQPPLTFQA